MCYYFQLTLRVNVVNEILNKLTAHGPVIESRENEIKGLDAFTNAAAACKAC